MSRNTVAKRRKREGKTDYKMRIRFVKANMPRLIIRKSLKNIMLQIVQFSPAGDKVLLSVHAHDIQKLGWKASNNNLPASYLCGYLLGKKAVEKKIKSEPEMLDEAKEAAAKSG